MRYQGKTQPFLTPQMTSGAVAAVLRSTVTGNAEDVAARFTEASKHTDKKTGEKKNPSHTYVGTTEYVRSNRYIGGPRTVLRFSVTGDFVLGMEYGSEGRADTQETRGALRALIRRTS